MGKVLLAILTISLALLLGGCVSQPACNTTADCGPSQECSGGYCVNITTTTVNSTTTSPSTTTVYTSTICPVGQNCINQIKTMMTECAHDTDCPSSGTVTMMCVNGRCASSSPPASTTTIAQCASDADCRPAGGNAIDAVMRCVYRECVSFPSGAATAKIAGNCSASGNQCPTGQVCMSGLCLAAA